MPEFIAQSLFYQSAFIFVLLLWHFNAMTIWKIEALSPSCNAFCLAWGSEIYCPVPHQLEITIEFLVKQVYNSASWKYFLTAADFVLF